MNKQDPLFELARKYLEQITRVLYLTSGEKTKLEKFIMDNQVTDNYKEEITDYLTDTIWRKKNNNQRKGIKL